MPDQLELPAVGTTEAIMGSSWSWGATAGNIVSNNTVYAQTNFSGNIDVNDRTVSLGFFGGGGVVGDNKANSANYPSTDTSQLYGGIFSGDLWGLNLSPSQVNNSSFAVYLASKSASDVLTFSDYLVARDFGFTLPKGAKIINYRVTIEKSRVFNGRANQSTIRIDYVQMYIEYLDRFVHRHSQTRVASNIYSGKAR